VDGLVDGGEQQRDEDEESEERAQNAEDELEGSAAADATVGKRLGALVQVVPGPLQDPELAFESLNLDHEGY